MGRRLRIMLVSVGALTALALPAGVLAADGDHHTQFNGTGELTEDLGGSSAQVFGSAVQPDGDLIVVGGLDSDGFVARYLPSGSLDTSFGGGDGWAVVDSGTTDGGERLRGVAIQPDHKIVVVGDASISTGNPFVLARLTSGGVLDASFDGPGGSGNGVFRVSRGAGTNATGNAIVASGTKVLFAGGVDNHSYVYSLNDDGTLDTSGFHNPDGFITFDFPCGFCSGESFLSGLAIQPSDGKIIAVGKPNNTAAGIGVARLTTAGQLDTAGFNSPTGMITLAAPSGYIGGNGNAAAFGPAGRILIGGSLTGSNPFPQNAAVAAVTSSGTLDTTFASGAGHDGYAILSGLGTQDSARGIAIQPDGKILIGGLTGSASPRSSFVARFSATGMLDTTTFAPPNGYSTATFGGTNSQASAFSVSATGVAYVSGGIGSSFPSTSYGIAAFDAFGPGAPILTSTTPSSPSSDNAPSVFGSGDAGSTVDIYASGDCSGSVVGTAAAETFASTGISVSVSSDTSTTFTARARWDGGTSACSSQFGPYVEDSTPPVTTVDSAPSGTTTVHSPVIAFHATDPHGPVSFECQIDAGAPAPCSSPATVGPLADGVHSVTVIATDGVGNVDPSPPSASFTVTTPQSAPGSSSPPPVNPPAKKKCKKKKHRAAAAKKKCKKKKK